MHIYLMKANFIGEMRDLFVLLENGPRYVSIIKKGVEMWVLFPIFILMQTNVFDCIDGIMGNITM